MKRLYYLTKNSDVAEKVSDRLHEQGITDWNFHVLSKDKADITRHHLHSTTPLQELDIVRSGERGVLAGFAVGIIVTGCMALFTSLGEHTGLQAQAATILLFSLFGAWMGGLVGVSTEHYKIRRFHEQIEAGFLLLMVDVKPSQRLQVQDVIRKFPYVRPAGEDTTVINPFAQPILQ